MEGDDHGHGHGHGTPALLCEILLKFGVRVFAFDMDQTITVHSRGELLRAGLQPFLQSATPDFSTAARAFHR